MDATIGPQLYLSELEAIDAALSAAVAWMAESEANTAFLCLDDALPRFGSDGEAFRVWGIAFVGLNCLQLVERADDLAVSIGASRDQRSRFVAACAGSFRARLDQLLGAHGLRGSA